ncbi:MAG: glycosyltransferase [Lentisphaeria bacterium]|nr:glycosyltransferase [Lentisphaeria bacterium]
MRILQVNTADRGGGAEGSAWNLFDRYRAAGQLSWLAVGRKYSNDPDVLEIPRGRANSALGRLLQQGAAVARNQEGRVPGMRRLARGLDRLAWPERLADWWHGRDEALFPGCADLPGLCPAPPDIIHCHNLHGWYFDLGVLPALSQRQPLILNLRDSWAITGHCAYFVDCERWRQGCGQCPHLDVYPACRRDATAANWQHKAAIYAQSRLYVTAPSQWLLTQARQSMLPAAEYRVIANGIDTACFCPGDRAAARAALGLPADAPTVLFASASSTNIYKDPATMALAILAMAERVPGLQVLCVGAALPDRALTRLAIRQVPYVRDPQKMAQLYRAADLFVHTAKAEAFGKTVTEAMACGTPVVASAVGGIVEQVIAGETGYLCPAGDAAAMANAAAEFFAADAGRQAAMRAATAQRGTAFSLDRQVRAFLSWYEEILAQEPWHGRAAR